MESSQKIIAGDYYNGIKTNKCESVGSNAWIECRYGGRSVKWAAEQIPKSRKAKQLKYYDIAIFIWMIG